MFHRRRDEDEGRSLVLGGVGVAQADLLVAFSREKCHF